MDPRIGTDNPFNGLNAGGDTEPDLFDFDNDGFLEGVVGENAGIFNYLNGISDPIICFATGTKIKTRAGEVAVERLKVGDEISTLDNGSQTIRWIGKRRLNAAELHAQPHLLPIRIKAGTLSKNVPSYDLLVSPQHRVLISSKIVSLAFVSMQVLVAAKHLTSVRGIEVATDVTHVDYWHILFENHEIVYANDALCESLYTGTEALKTLQPGALEEILTLFPELRDKYQSNSLRTVRPIARGKKGRQLLMRHIQNSRSLQEH